MQQLQGVERMISYNYSILNLQVVIDCAAGRSALQFTMMNSKAALLLILAISSVALLTCSPADAAVPHRIGSVQLINAVGAKVIVPLCSGPYGDHRGPAFIDFPGSESFQFPVDIFIHGWTCSFEYVNTAEGGRKYTANVLVWKGVLPKSNSADVPEYPSLMPDYVPCYDCIWKIQRDGFYLADDKNHTVFQFIGHWK
ncbi:hypothetical protein M758_1G317000 [Ceratodon purpureus]|nr:hypothetical protein M758_1G317000 [Ceratodon purpureus]